MFKKTSAESKKSKSQFQREKLLAQLDQEPPQDSHAFQEDAEESGQFKELYNKSLFKQKFEAGCVVKGRIIEVDDDYVVVDVNYKSEGLVPKSEFQGANGIEGVEIGREVEVYIDSIENDSGMMELSKNRADIVRAWKDISQTAKSQKIIQGVVIAKMKGGLHVDIGGVKAFLPGSQVELRPVKDLSQYIGKTYSFKIIRFNQKRGNIVLSRRVILEEERESLRSQTLGGIEKGAVVNGIVKNITDYGAFLDLGGIDGLLHITDICWNRIQHPSDKIKIGETLKVKVLKIDREKSRVSLGLKQLKENENPWERIEKEIKEGDIVQGKVISLTDYGAFVAVKEGIEGLVHISEMSWGKKIKSPSDLLKTGEEVKLKVIGMDREHQRISFSIKRLEENPWLKWIEKYPKGARVEAVVKSTADFGLFVEFDEKQEGLIRSVDLSWSIRSNVKPRYSIGDKLTAVILGFSEEEERFHLGVKQLKANPWEQIELTYPIGSVHQVKVVKVVDFGVFVELGEKGVEGLIHVSELSTKRVNKVEDVVKLGDVISAEIITMDKEFHKIGLSAKLVQLRKELKSSKEEAEGSPESDKKEEEKEEGFFAKALKASMMRRDLKNKDKTDKTDKIDKTENTEES